MIKEDMNRNRCLPEQDTNEEEVNTFKKRLLNGEFFTGETLEFLRAPDVEDKTEPKEPKKELENVVKKSMETKEQQENLKPVKNIEKKRKKVDKQSYTLCEHIVRKLAGW